jgi:ubiquitin-like 1-activating enzyme E1 A
MQSKSCGPPGELEIAYSSYLVPVKKRVNMNLCDLLFELALTFLVLWLFQLANGGRLPLSSSQEDMVALFKLRDERLRSAQVDSSFVDDDLLQ